MRKHISTEKPPTLYVNGETCCLVYTVVFCNSDHKYCCHGGHGKRKRNIANYVRSLEIEQIDVSLNRDDRMFKGEGGDYS